MKLQDVKAVILNGFRIEVEYTNDVNKLEGDNLGNINHSNAIIYIKKSMVPWMQSQTLWHEIAHSICYLYKIIESEKDPEIEFNERETHRMASALNSLEIEYEEPEQNKDKAYRSGWIDSINKKFEKTETTEVTAIWYLLGQRRPVNESICILAEESHGSGFQCVKWNDKEDYFILDTGEMLFKQNILWTNFDQKLWDRLVDKKEL